METYHKIQTLFKRHTEGKNKGKMIRGDWTTNELKYLAGNQWEFTEKVDGTNIRVELFNNDGGINVRFGGRTASADIPPYLTEYLENVFLESPIGSVGRFMIDNGHERVLLFGEGYGPKIQAKVGGLYRDDHAFVLFDVKIGDFWLTRKDVDDVANKLGVDSVPTIGYGTLHDAIDIVSSGITFEDSGAVKRWGSGTLNSKWGNFPAEGIVARPSVPMFDRKGHRIITKIKAVDFK